jgi:hypothetical protein
MKACRAWISSSNAVITTVITAPMMPTPNPSTVGFSTRKCHAVMANSATSRWPANMFANNRTECVNGRTMKFDANSIGMMSG